jgi:hypothetical protein
VGNKVKQNILFFPIERYDERYSAQWYDWMLQAFEEYCPNANLYVVGDTTLRSIKVGEFLDVFETTKYKAQQTEQAIKILETTKGPFSAFFMDLWHPGVASIKYAADLAGIDLKISGMLHAGTWDPHDFLTKRVGSGNSWARHQEAAILSAANKVYVATNFHKDLITKTFPFIDSKISIVDFPMIKFHSSLTPMNKQPIVVWPHRKADEKDPMMFELIEEKYRLKYGNHAAFVMSKDFCSSKKAYYDLLSEAAVAVSTAKQETFGIAMLEAMQLRCWPVVPDRLSYVELYPRQCRYRTTDEAVELIRKSLVSTATGHLPPYCYEPSLEWLREVGSNEFT